MGIGTTLKYEYYGVYEPFWSLKYIYFMIDGQNLIIWNHDIALKFPPFPPFKESLLVNTQREKYLWGIERLPLWYKNHFWGTYVGFS